MSVPDSSHNKVCQIGSLEACPHSDPMIEQSVNDGEGVQS